MSKPVIAIDVDDVLAANAEGFIAYSNEKWGTKLKTDDYDEHWAMLWNVDNAETEKRAIDFHGSGAVRSYRHFEEAVPVLRSLAENYRLVITTSRRLQIKADTIEWIDQYFGDIFSEIRFAGMWDKVTDHSIKATKAELCKEIGAKYLIDDQLKHCTAAADAGIEALLFGEYTWNKTRQLPGGVTRVKDWNEVLEYFDAKRGQ